MEGIGLSKKELTKLASFGGTPEEVTRNLFGESGGLGNVIDHTLGALQQKTIELILENNRRISEQLAQAGIKLAP